jgi:membrane protease YdiL (CAAX protease family)
METMAAYASLVTPANGIAALLALAPYLWAAFFPQSAAAGVCALPRLAQLLSPALLCLPYLLVSLGAGNFRWGWFAVYLALPVAIAALLAPPSLPAPSAREAAGSSAPRHGWRAFPGRELLVLAILGLSVDLRWFESAWPAHLAVFNKILLLDAGIYAFVLLRQLEGTGFDLRLRRADIAIGLREAAFYTPIALALGLALGFLHLHRSWPGLAPIAGAWIFTFFFIAVPEELFFRGWLQNLLESRIGRTPALFVTAALFGLAHFNKRAAQFNWRYVLLAALAGLFYGRAWRRNRRVAASAVTHATVDALWSLWLR